MIGLALGLVATRLLEALLFGVRAGGPLTLNHAVATEWKLPIALQAPSPTPRAICGRSAHTSAAAPASSPAATGPVMALVIVFSVTIGRNISTDCACHGAGANDVRNQNVSACAFSHGISSGLSVRSRCTFSPAGR